MLKEHPLLGLDDDGFKLEMLCINDYSGWCKNHFTPSSELKGASSTKSEPKEEPKEESNDTISPLATKGNKRKSDPAHSMNAHAKRPKGCTITTELSAEETQSLILKPSNADIGRVNASIDGVNGSIYSVLTYSVLTSLKRQSTIIASQRDLSQIPFFPSRKTNSR